MTDEEISESQRINNQIEIWLNRAAMAYQQRNIELVKVALDRRWQFQLKLAELDGSMPPQPPNPDDFFREWEDPPQRHKGDGRWGPKPGDPDQPAPVPRRPLPTAGAGEVALPLPEQSNENETS